MLNIPGAHTVVLAVGAVRGTNLCGGGGGGEWAG